MDENLNDEESGGEDPAAIKLKPRITLMEQMLSEGITRAAVVVWNDFQRVPGEIYAATAPAGMTAKVFVDANPDINTGDTYVKDGVEYKAIRYRF